MKLTDREKIILLLAPLAVVLGAYAWWFNLFVRAKFSAAQQAYEAAVAGQVSPTALVQEQARKTALQGEIDELQKQKTALESRAAGIAGQKTDALRGIQAEQQLTELFQRHALRLIEEGPGVQHGAAALPGSLAEAIGRVAGTGKPPAEAARQVRRLRLAGRYPDLLAALRELAQAEHPPGIPLSVTMAEADVDVEQRSWTLLIWM